MIRYEFIGGDDVGGKGISRKRMDQDVINEPLLNVSEATCGNMSE